MSQCQRLLREAGKPYPRTCQVCGLSGKCTMAKLVPVDAEPMPSDDAMGKMVKALGDRLAAKSLIRHALYNGRRIGKPEFKRMDNWVLCMELFAVGSTYAYELCRLAEVDPNGKEFKLHV